MDSSYLLVYNNSRGTERNYCFCLTTRAAVVELVDTRDSKFRVLTDVPVRFRPAVPVVKEFDYSGFRALLAILAVIASRGASLFHSQYVAAFAATCPRQMAIGFSQDVLVTFPLLAAMR
jgi:hypothetical protein